MLFLKHQRRSFIDYKKITTTFRFLWRTWSHCFLLFHYFRWYFDQLVEFIIKSVKSIHLSVFENVVVVPSKPNICFQFHCKTTWKNVCVCAVYLPNAEILTSVFKEFALFYCRFTCNRQQYPKIIYARLLCHCNHFSLYFFSHFFSYCSTLYSSFCFVFHSFISCKWMLLFVILEFYFREDLFESLVTLCGIVFFFLLGVYLSSRDLILYGKKIKIVSVWVINKYINANNSNVDFFS